MKFLINLIGKIFGFNKTIAMLSKLSQNQSEQLENTRGKMFIHVETPIGNEINKLTILLSDLSKNKYFLFYLTALENEIFSIIRDCSTEKIEKVAHQMRGALQLINRVRRDADLSYSTINKTETSQDPRDPDFILKKMDLLLHGRNN
jgi:hypothetical protein